MMALRFREGNFMQTVKEKCLEMLTNNGMFDSQAQAVFESAKPLIEVDGYRMTWDRPSDEYPLEMYAVINLILKREALSYIDQNCPRAWFRPMFCDDPQAEILRLQSLQQSV